MKRVRIFAVVLLGVLFVGVAGMAEDITLTTYYPAPYGAYDELTTTGDTYLATDSEGNVGIGTTQPGVGQKLNVVGGNIRLEEGDLLIEGDGISGDMISLLNEGLIYTGGVIAVAGSGISYFTGDVGIGTMSPATGYKLDVQGKIQATVFDVGDITFRDQKSDQILWRMFEDEVGLYLENVKTGKIYSFVLQEVDR